MESRNMSEALPLSDDEIVLLAKELRQARQSKTPIPALTKRYPTLTLMDGYRIQTVGISLEREAGETVCGLKMGLTSESKRQQMNLHEAIYGVLTESTLIQGGTFQKGLCIHPRIEPELAFFTHRELKGNVSRVEALDACEWVSSAFEIIDSRYLDFKYFSLPDVIADNCSAGFFKLGNVRVDPRAIDLSALSMEVTLNGKVMEPVSSREISGDPALSIVQLCQLLAQTGRVLPAGSIILAGAACPAIPLEAESTALLRVDGLGVLELSVE